MNNAYEAQLTLFSTLAHTGAENTSEEEKNIQSPTQWWIYIDGASRRNPGLAGAGIYILKDGVPLYQDGYFLGIRTNNQAEYLAFLLGLFLLKKWYKQGDSVRVFSDSQLLVRQVHGMYKVRNELLKPLHNVAVNMAHRMGATIAHVMREDNTHADKMANHGIETKKGMPKDFIRMLQTYEVGL